MHCQAVFSAVLSCFILNAVNGIIDLVPNNTAAVVGDEVRLVCECANTASGGIDWQIESVAIVGGCNIIDTSYRAETIGDSCVLIIPSVSLSQAVVYTCVYATWDGSTHDAQVIVADNLPIISISYVNDNATIKCIGSLPNFSEVNSFTANIILSSDNSEILLSGIPHPCSSSSCEAVESVISATALSANLYCTVYYISSVPGYQGSDAWLTNNSTITFHEITESTDASTVTDSGSGKKDDSEGPPVGPIVGGVLGGFALLGIVVLVAWRIQKHKSENADGRSNHSSVSPPVTPPPPPNTETELTSKAVEPEDVKPSVSNL